MFKMKDVVCKRILVWNPDCTTRRKEWVALLDKKQIATADTKAELLDSVRRYRNRVKE